MPGCRTCPPGGRGCWATAAAAAIVLSTTSTVVVLAVLVAIFLLAPGSAAGQAHVPQPGRHVAVLRGQPARPATTRSGEALWLNIRMFVAAEILILIAGPGGGGHQAVDRAGPAAAAGGRHHLRRRGPGVPLILIIFMIGFGAARAPAHGHLGSVGGGVRGGRAGLVVLGLRVRGIPGRDQRGAPQPGRGGPLARPVAGGRDAVRDPAAGRPQRHPAAAQRLHHPAEGHRAGRAARARSRRTRRPRLYSDTVFNYSSYVVAAILFLILTIPLARFTDHLIRRDQARRLAGAGQ